jgi:hypothetical protein
MHKLFTARSAHNGVEKNASCNEVSAASSERSKAAEKASRRRLMTLLMAVYMGGSIKGPLYITPSVSIKYQYILLMETYHFWYYIIYFGVSINEGTPK